MAIRSLRPCPLHCMKLLRPADCARASARSCSAPRRVSAWVAWCWTGVRILVTGATGGLGRNAVEFLLKRGVAVAATGEKSAGAGRSPNLAPLSRKWILRAARGRPWRDCLNGWMRYGTARQCPRHGLPGACSGKQCRCDRKTADAAGGGAKCFVHVSTPGIYFDFPIGMVSNSGRKPVNEYARTKALAEQKVQAAARTFPALRTVILRPRAIFGPYDQVLIPRLQQMLVAKKGRLPLPRGGRAVIDMTYVENVVHAMWLAAHHAGLPSGSAFNITNE